MSFFPDDRAYQIALGNIDINTGETIGHFNPHDFQVILAEYISVGRTRDVLDIAVIRWNLDV